MLNHPVTQEPRLLIIGDYLFDPEVGSLSGPSGAHHLCSRMSTLLSVLVKYSEDVVERDILLREVYGDGPSNADSLNQCIARLRHYLGDSAKAANYIETVPNQGYRLVASVYGCTNKPVVLSVNRNDSHNPNFGAGIYRLFAQFRERKVCRSMLIYTMVVWLIFQVTEVVVPPLRLPDWVNSLVVILGLLGFPVAATLSWIFNLTPSGLVRDTSSMLKTGASTTRNRTDLALDSALILAALVVCGALVFASTG